MEKLFYYAWGCPKQTFWVATVFVLIKNDYGVVKITGFQTVRF